MEGWIKLHRKLYDNPIFFDRDLLQFWIYLLMKCNHEDGFWVYNFEKIQIKKGQCVISQRKLSKELGQHPMKINRMIKYLKNDTQIDTRTDKQFTMVTILNWDKYQNGDTPLLHKIYTSDTQSETNKNVKNVKNSINTREQVPVEKKLEGYGNEDINTLFNVLDKNMVPKLPRDQEGRRKARNILQLMTKHDSKGKIKVGREWLKDRMWDNVRSFMDWYLDNKGDKGYSAQTWVTFYRNISLWMANEGKLNLEGKKKWNQ